VRGLGEFARRGKRDKKFIAPLSRGFLARWEPEKKRKRGAERHEEAPQPQVARLGQSQTWKLVSVSVSG
jgi:hypothetical protein